MAAQIGVERLLQAPAAGQTRQITHNQACRMHIRRLVVHRIDAGVADMRISQGDDLARVGRIGEDFLVTGDRGIEHHFADGLTFRADGNSAEQTAIFERE